MNKQIKSELWNVAPGIQVRDGKRKKSIRYFASVAGKRYTATSRLEYVDAVNSKTHRPTKLLNDDYAAWLMSIQDEAQIADRYGLRTPSIRELLEVYEEIADERSRNPLFGRPSERAIYAAVTNFRHVVEAAGLTDERPVTVLFDKFAIQRAFDRLGARISPISAWSYIISLRSVTAKWTISKYEARGFRVTPPSLPDKPMQANAPQYHLPSQALRDKIDAWYLDLAQCEDRRLYLAASMTYQLAVRPIDTGLLTADNFREDPQDGLVHLVYKPHKTVLSSGRVVDWPILPTLWEVIRGIAGERLDAGLPLIHSPKSTYGKLNASMRDACGITGSKAVYELRKLCVDTIRRTMGADYAVAISGDRRDTIDKYYSDPYKMIGVKPIEIGPMRSSTAQGSAAT